ncbi:MAG: prepilin-type N-terminal cleavage/methylation domain-containing protein [Candidatus Omnitrophica bacterium]|nr:prepilin-type N-terminal cleavage/methylation domain-containing protein [Candidatus Omnitrophota bacterium]
MKNNYSTHQKGFTLIEIIVVVIIIGFVAAFALPNISYIIEKTKSSEGKQILLSLLNAQKVYKLDHDAYALNVDALDVQIPNSANFSPPAIDINGNLIAAIQRNTGTYSLEIFDNGTISCVKGSGDSTICQKIGY